MLREQSFVEHAIFSSNYYGTSLRALEAVTESNRIPILDIEMEVRLACDIHSSND